MKIVVLEPFFSGSHRQWGEEYQLNSSHEVVLLHLPGRFWIWRMFGAAVTLAEKFQELTFDPDLMIASDMLDLATFLGLIGRQAQNIPSALYFHENQITYPWSQRDEDVKLNRNHQYGFINYTSALAADRLFFNSHFHRKAFLERLPGFLKQFPDYQGTKNVPLIESKSEVLPVGLQFAYLEENKINAPFDKPLILWNHRWEYDKGPEAFFEVLLRLKSEGVAFSLVILGDCYQEVPDVFRTAMDKLREEIVFAGFVPSKKDYAHWLWKADILPVTSYQENFGISVVEAIYCGCYPLLPNRLVYPEHIPSSHRGQHLYENKAELYAKLKWAMINIEAVRKANEPAKHVKQYDWRLLTSRYDAAFEALVNRTFSQKTSGK